MSLLVYAYQRALGKGTADFIPLEPSDGYSELAGFETWRTEVWGSSALIELGARILPRLAVGDIYAEGDEIADLEADVNLVLEHGRTLFGADGFESVETRAQNILDAVRIARMHPHRGVYVG